MSLGERPGFQKSGTRDDSSLCIAPVFTNPTYVSGPVHSGLVEKSNPCHFSMQDARRVSKLLQEWEGG